MYWQLWTTIIIIISLGLFPGIHSSICKLYTRSNMHALSATDSLIFTFTFLVGSLVCEFMWERLQISSLEIGIHLWSRNRVENSHLSMAGHNFRRIFRTTTGPKEEKLLKSNKKVSLFIFFLQRQHIFKIFKCRFIQTFASRCFYFFFSSFLKTCVFILWCGEDILPKKSHHRKKYLRGKI